MRGSGQARAYWAGAGFASGFAAVSFHYAWVRLVPPIFPSRALSGSWVTCSVLLSFLLGTVYLSRKDLYLGYRARLSAAVQIALGIAAVMAWQLIRAMNGLPDFLQGAGLASDGAVSAVAALTTIAVVFVPGFLLALIVLLGSYQTPPGEGRSSTSLAHILTSAFLGGAVGYTVLGLWLVPTLGLGRSLMVGAGAVLVSGLVGLLPLGMAEEDGGATESPHGGLHLRWLAKAVIFTIHVACAVSCSLLAARLVMVAIGRPVQGDSALLAACFGGLALGCFLGAKVSRLPRPNALWLGILMGAAGLFYLGFRHFADRLPLVFIGMLRDQAPTWAHLAGVYFLLALAALFAPGVLLGSTILLYHRSVSTEGSRPGWFKSGVGLTALGAAAAFLVTASLPSRDLDFDTLLRVLPWTLVGLGILMMVLSREDKFRRLAAAVATIAVGIGLSSSIRGWEQGVVTSGVYRAPTEFAQVADLGALLRSTEMVFYQEDSQAITSVDRTGDVLSLRISGEVREVTGDDFVSQVMNAHVPLLLHPGPRNALLVGLGSGITLGSMESHPLKQITCVDAHPASARAAQIFSPYNGNALSDDRLELVLEDPYRYLLLSDQDYDVIIVDSPPPYSYDGARLFSADFVDFLRSRLTGSGLICQVIRTFDLPLACFRSVIKSFAYHFPQVTLWWTGADRMLLVGSMQPFSLGTDDLAARINSPSVRQDLTRVKTTDPLGILSCFVMGREKLIQLAANQPASTFDRNVVAYQWPTLSLAKGRMDLLQWLDSAAENPVSLVADLDQDSAEYKLLRDRLGRSVRSRTLYIKAMELTHQGRIAEAVTYLRNARDLCPENGMLTLKLSDYLMVLATTLADEGHLEEGIEAARRSVELHPENPRTFYILAVLEKNRDVDRAIGLLNKALELDPSYVAAYIAKAEIELLADRAEEAAQTVGYVLSLEPQNTRAHHLRALSLIRRQRYEEGRAELELVLDAHPENVDAMEALAYSWLLDGELKKAQDLYEAALEISPGNLAILNNYATILAEKGDYQKAIAIWTRALELNPDDQNLIENIKEATQKMRR